MFTANPSISNLNTPWFLDYGHLVFWFFFFASFVLVLWLTYFAISIISLIEPRRPVRETRGFSRAQTGDALTAVLPMTWSITMLMHASTHSSNFDENVAVTGFSFTVIAYQWGWNYYFPRDLVSLLTQTSKLVGRGNSAAASDQVSYGALLEKARADYLARLTNRGFGGSRWGQLTLPNTFALSGRLLSSPALIQDAAQRQCFGALQHFPITRHFANAGLYDGMNLAAWRLGFIRPSLVAAEALLPGIQHTVLGGQRGFIGVESNRNASRSLATATHVGNRLNRIHRLFSSGKQLPRWSQLSTTQANFFRRTSQLSTSYHQTQVSLPRTNTTLSWENQSYWHSAKQLCHRGWLDQLTQALLRGNLGYGFQSIFSASLTPRSSLAERQLWQRFFWYGPELTSANLGPSVLTIDDTYTNVAATATLISEATKGAALRFFLQQLNTAHRVSTAQPICMAGQLTLDSSVLLRPSGVANPLLAGAVLTGDAMLIFSLQNLACLRYAPSLLGLRAALASEIRINLLTSAARVMPARLTTLALSAAPSYNLTSEFIGLTLAVSSRPLSSMQLTSRSPVALMGGLLSRTGYASSPLSPGEFTLGAAKPNLPLTIFSVGGLMQAVRPFMFSTLTKFDTGVSQPSFQPDWISGANETRPVLLPNLPYTEPFSVGVKAASPALPILTDTLLPRWQKWWLDGVKFFGQPWDRLTRNQLSSRPWSGVWANEVSWFRPSSEELDLSKIAFMQPRLSLWRHIRLPFYPELSTAVLDNEWSSLVETQAIALPKPYADIDLAFIHRRWAFEVNTTRRSDHDLRYKVSWGPLAAFLLSAHASSEAVATQSWAASVGPAFFQTLAPSLARQLSLIRASELSLKLATSSSIKNIQASYASLAFNAGEASFLNPVEPLASRRAKACNVLRVAPKSSYSFAWAQLWLFKPAAARLAFVHSQDLPFVSLAAISWRNALNQVLTLRPQSTSFLYPLAHNASLLSSAPLVVGPRPARSGFMAIREDVGSIRRLRVTRGVCLPSDIALHGIFGSKDVIHSWAIPGLGIKIDCIPGYNSHRRVLLRWRGLYWGQCMEVCGRYHHWMPILVNVVHRDIFLSWCLAYVRAVDSASLTQTQGSLAWPAQQALIASLA